MAAVGVTGETESTGDEKRSATTGFGDPAPLFVVCGEGAAHGRTAHSTWRDENGLWFVDGRDDDMIVSGGENVFPLEVENQLAGHPAVVETSVVGVDDLEFGKRLCAFVVRRRGAELDADEVKSYVRAELARHKVPRDVVFVDTLPRNETGKVLKAQLQREWT